MKEESHDPNIDPELEARIVALVLGEASDFERDELERLIEQRPALASLKKRLQSVHGLLADVAMGEPILGDEDWQLSTERRNAVLSVISGETAAEADRAETDGAEVTEIVEVTEIAEETEKSSAQLGDKSSKDRRNAKDRRTVGSLLLSFARVAAVFCLIAIAGGLAVWERMGTSYQRTWSEAAKVAQPPAEVVVDEMDASPGFFGGESRTGQDAFQADEKYLSAARGDKDPAAALFDIRNNLNKYSVGSIEGDGDSEPDVTAGTPPPKGPVTRSPNFRNDSPAAADVTGGISGHSGGWEFGKVPGANNGQAPNQLSNLENGRYRESASPKTDSDELLMPQSEGSAGYRATFKRAQPERANASAVPPGESGENSPQHGRTRLALPATQDTPLGSQSGLRSHVVRNQTTRSMPSSGSPSTTRGKVAQDSGNPPADAKKSRSPSVDTERDGRGGDVQNGGDRGQENGAQDRSEREGENGGGDFGGGGGGGAFGSGAFGQKSASGEKTVTDNRRRDMSDQDKSKEIASSAGAAGNAPRSDLDLPFLKDGFNSAVPQFGGFDGAGADKEGRNEQGQGGQAPGDYESKIATVKPSPAKRPIDGITKIDRIEDLSNILTQPGGESSQEGEKGKDWRSLRTSSGSDRDLPSGEPNGIEHRVRSSLDKMSEVFEQENFADEDSTSTEEGSTIALEDDLTWGDYVPPKLVNSSGSMKISRTAVPSGLNEKSADAEAFSTFSLHVSDVSFKLARAALSQGAWPEPEKIRIEEFVNAFDYGDPLPRRNERVACALEQSIHPFLQQRNVLRISMRTAAAGRSSNTPLRLTLLLDNSGSMERPDRQKTVRRAFALLAQQLKPIDQVTLISFARRPRLLADKINGSQSQHLIQLIDNLPSEGGTNIEAALKLAFEKAQEQQVTSAQNRIVLLTDGAVNLGDAEPESLSRMIATMREAGIAFDAAGISADGLNDEVLEALTRQGDGRYYLLDSPEDADDGFARQIAGALRPSAQNVKLQIEFNPKRVGRYKLLGFENRRLNKEDFRDDTVDAAEMTAAEAGVALYQFEAKPDGEGDVGSVSVRFRDLSTGRMVEELWPIPYQAAPPRPDQAAPSLRIATSAAMLASKLRGEPLGETVDLKALSNLISGLPERDRNVDRVQHLQFMIQQTRQLSGN